MIDKKLTILQRHEYDTKIPISEDKIAFHAFLRPI
jgi:hypothetical protein